MKKRIALFLVLCVIAMFGLEGCGASAPTPTETANTFLTGIQKGDDDAINSVYEPGDFNIGEAFNAIGDSTEAVNEDEEILKALLAKIPEFEYEVSDEQVKDKEATVAVKITTYPFGEAMKDFMTDYFSKALEMAFSDPSDKEMEKLANSLFKEKLDALKEKTYTKTATLTMTQKDGVWKIDKIEEDSDFADALLGGMLSSIKDLDGLFSDNGGQ